MYIVILVFLYFIDGCELATWSTLDSKYTSSKGGNSAAQLQASCFIELHFDKEKGEEAWNLKIIFNHAHSYFSWHFFFCDLNFCVVVFLLPVHLNSLS